MQGNHWETKSQLAQIHGVTVRTVTNWVNSGKVQRKEIDGQLQFRLKPRKESYYFASQTPSYSSTTGPTAFLQETKPNANELQISELKERVGNLEEERLEYIQRLAELESRQRYMQNLLDAYALQRQRTFWAWLVSSFKRLFALV